MAALSPAPDGITQVDSTDVLGDFEIPAALGGGSLDSLAPESILPALNDLVETTPEQLDRFIEQLNSLSAQLEDADLDPEQALEVNQLFELLSQEVDGEAPAPEDIELLQQLLQDVEPEAPESDEADQQAEPETDSESNFDLETLAAQAGWGVIAAKARKKK